MSTSSCRAGIAVLVDARNVLRSQWPNIGEQELVELCRAWAAAARREAIVVFDGRAPGVDAGERRIDAHCVVVASGSESADAWLEQCSARLRAAGRPYWLVTSDRALREVAGRGAEQTIGGGSFAALLRPRQAR